MAHLSAKEEKEHVRGGGRKRQEGHKNRELELLSQDIIPSKGCSTSPNHCGLEDNQVKARSEQSRANTALSMACRKRTTELTARLTSAPANRAKTACRALALCGAPMPRPRASQRGLTCDAEIRDTSCRPVRSDEETLAGAPRCNLMLTFLSLSTLEIALGDVFPVGAENRETTTSAWLQHPVDKRGQLPHPTHQTAGFGRWGWRPWAL